MEEGERGTEKLNVNLAERVAYDMSRLICWSHVCLFYGTGLAANPRIGPGYMNAD